MKNKDKLLIEILRDLITYQKIPCDCITKDGIEWQSVYKAVKEIKELYDK